MTLWDKMTDDINIPNYEVNYKLWDWNSKVWQSWLWHTMSLLWNKNVKLWESQKWPNCN